MLSKAGRSTIFGNGDAPSGHGKVTCRGSSPRQARIPTIRKTLLSRAVATLCVMLLGFVACDVVPIEMAKDVDALPALQARAWSEVRAFEVLQTAECDRASFAVRLGGASSSTGYTLVGEPGTLSVAIEGSPYVDTILVVYPMTDPAATTPPEALFVDDDGGDGGLSAIDGVELTGWEADAPRSALGHLVLSRWEGDAESDLRLTVSIDGVTLCPSEGAQ